MHDEDRSKKGRSRSPTGASRSVGSERVRLVLFLGEGTGRVWTVGDDPVVIGRGDEADVRVTADDVSREHARISRQSDGSYLAEDLESRNGTWVNGVPIKRQPVQFGDRIQVGEEVVLIFSRYDNLEERLSHLQRLDAVGRIAAGAAHDFGNLLQVITNNLSYALERVAEVNPIDTDLDESLREAMQAASRGGEISRALLNFARRDRAQSALLMVDRLVGEVAGLVKRSLPKNVSLETDTGQNLVIRGDQSGLHQALMNLCINAIDAMPAGGVLRIEAHDMQVADHEAVLEEGPLLAPGHYVLVTVSDTGIGMDQATRGRLFEPFFTTKDKGTGLGLASVYGAVKNHGGQIQVQSAPGKGTSFRIHLPSVRQGPMGTTRYQTEER